MRHAIVDIGSNTIRLIVFDVENNDIKNSKKVLNKKYTAGLITYVHDGELSGKGIKKLKKTLQSIKNIVDELKCDTFSPFATASLRNLDNTEEVVEEIHNELDIDIDVLEQVDEAYMGNIGIRQEICAEEGITIDIGGASTEIVLFDEDGPQEFVNLETGSLLLFRENVSFVTPKKKEIRMIKKSVYRELKGNSFSKKFGQIIGIGGTIRTTGQVISDLWNTDSKHFTLEHIDRLLELIKDKDTEAIRTIIRANPARIHTIIPGMIILRNVMKYFDIDEIRVSNKGLREGYLIYRVLEGK
ncbi:phosphatase [Peptoniphilus sp. MSJ-1]|uniref:Phosphatase n=1 Tax=Peptoniphilus ovalis TaxID=2841503 RepID=A0ABS6FGY9_9FIRM|nr:phosphatase [Peptoniphilus ovalis]MBU5668792.1 phosphatase [Peptoniphilus ovalis]